MSMFWDGSMRQNIYEELKYIFDDKYGDWDNAEDKLNFTTEVLYVLHTMFGDW